MRVLVVLSLLIGLYSCQVSIGNQSDPKVRFCESVDDGDCKGESDEFEPDSAFVILLTQDENFEMHSIVAKLIDDTEGEGKEIGSYEYEVDDKKANYLSIPMKGLRPGQYRAVFTDDKGGEIAQGKLSIKGERSPSAEIIFGDETDEQGMIIGKGDTFKPGGFAFAIRSLESFGANHIDVTMYSQDGQLESIVDRATLDVSPEWNYFSYPISFKEPGMYRIEASINGEVLASGEVRIEQ